MYFLEAGKQFFLEWNLLTKRFSLPITGVIFPTLIQQEQMPFKFLTTLANSTLTTSKSFDWKMFFQLHTPVAAVGMKVTQSRTVSVHHDALSGQMNPPQMSGTDCPCCSPTARFGSLPKFTQLFVMMGNSNVVTKCVISSHFQQRYTQLCTYLKYLTMSHQTRGTAHERCLPRT